jgi:hypothetical protein
VLRNRPAMVQFPEREMMMMMMMRTVLFELLVTHIRSRFSCKRCLQCQW